MVVSKVSVRNVVLVIPRQSSCTIGTYGTTALVSHFQMAQCADVISSNCVAHVPSRGIRAEFVIQCSAACVAHVASMMTRV